MIEGWEVGRARPKPDISQAWAKFFLTRLSNRSDSVLNWLVDPIGPLAWIIIYSFSINYNILDF